MKKKKNKKKAAIAAVFIIAAIIFLLYKFYLNNDDSTSPTIIVSDESAKIGGEAYVTVSVKNNPGIAGFVLELEYDRDKLKPVEITKGDIISEGLFDSNLSMQESEGLLKATWFNVSDMTKDGELYTIKFKVISETKGKVPVTISYTEGNIANQALELVEFETKDANVTIKN